jgi:hypothetical protein
LADHEDASTVVLERDDTYGARMTDDLALEGETVRSDERRREDLEETRVEPLALPQVPEPAVRDLR